MSRIIGTVHASPFFSRPVLTMLSKSSLLTNPSRGLKMPSAMFSISFRSSLLTCTVNMSSSSFIFFLSDMTNLFTSLPPCGNGIELPDTLHHTHTHFAASASFSKGQSVGRTLFAQHFPTTIFLHGGLRLALLPLYMARSQYWESPYHEVCYTARHFCGCSPIPCQMSSQQVG